MFQRLFKILSLTACLVIPAHRGAMLPRRYWSRSRRSGIAARTTRSPT